MNFIIKIVVLVFLTSSLAFALGGKHEDINSSFDKNTLNVIKIGKEYKGFYLDQDLKGKSFKNETLLLEELENIALDYVIVDKSDSSKKLKLNFYSTTCNNDFNTSKFDYKYSLDKRNYQVVSSFKSVLKDAAEYNNVSPDIIDQMSDFVAAKRADKKVVSGDEFIRVLKEKVKERAERVKAENITHSFKKCEGFDEYIPITTKPKKLTLDFYEGKEKVGSKILSTGEEEHWDFGVALPLNDLSELTWDANTSSITTKEKPSSFYLTLGRSIWQDVRADGWGASLHAMVQIDKEPLNSAGLSISIDSKFGSIFAGRIRTRIENVTDTDYNYEYVFGISMGLTRAAKWFE